MAKPNLELVLFILTTGRAIGFLVYVKVLGMSERGCAGARCTNVAVICVESIMMVEIGRTAKFVPEPDVCWVTKILAIAK